MAYRLNLTKEQEKRIAEVCISGEKSLTALASELGIGRTVVRREIREKGLCASIVRNSNSGIPIKWTTEMLSTLKAGYADSTISVEDLGKKLGISACTTQEKAKELGLRKARKTIWNHKNLSELRELAQSCNILQISDALGMCSETVQKKVKELQIEVRHKLLRSGKLSLKGNFGSFVNDVECFSFITSLANPKLTNAEIADKFNISTFAVNTCRKSLFPTFYAKIDYSVNFSELEIKFKHILDDLDIVFTRTKRIGKFSVDFYLGSKLCIELDGEYYHSSPERKRRDLRKSIFLHKKGYHLLRVKERELQDVDTLKEKVLNFYRFPLAVMLRKQGCEQV